MVGVNSSATTATRQFSAPQARRAASLRRAAAMTVRAEMAITTPGSTQAVDGFYGSAAAGARGGVVRRSLFSPMAAVEGGAEWESARAARAATVASSLSGASLATSLMAMLWANLLLMSQTSPGPPTGPLNRGGWAG